MKIVVTGALGHIGSYLIRKIPLHLRTKEIILVDSLITQRFVSLFNLPKEGNYSFIKSDVRDLNLDNIIEEEDIVINLSAITDAEGSFENAEDLEANNFECTSRIANSCYKKNAKLINLSSTSVYGDQPNLVDEDCLLKDLKPQSPYAETKLKEEEFVKELVSSKKLKACILRLGTIYGVSPGMRFHTAVNKFCWQAAFGEPLTVWETAYKLKRPYLSLEDGVSTIMFLIKNDLFEGEIYNILTGNHSVEEVILTIKKFIPVEIKFVESKIINQLSYEVSRKKIEEKGFKFQGNLQSGIEETIFLLKN